MPLIIFAFSALALSAIVGDAADRINRRTDCAVLKIDAACAAIRAEYRSR